MKKNTIKTVILIIVALQFGLLLYSIIRQESILGSSGKTIVLELRPVDPRSVIQGDYVILEYELARSVDYNEDKNKTIRIVLSPDEENIYTYERIYKKDHKLGENEIMVKGRVHQGDLKFGIESFFIEELSGGDVERQGRYALVKVIKTGEAKILHVLKSPDPEDIIY